MAFWRVFSMSTLDWKSKVQVFPSAFPWGRVLNGGKGGTSTFKLGDKKVAETATPTTLAPWSRMLIIESSGLIIYAGFITGSEYDRDTQTLTVNHEDLRAVLNRRLVAGTSKDAHLTFSGISLLQLAVNVVFEAQNDAARFNLPIALPANTTGSATGEFFGYHYPLAGDELTFAMDIEGGPDIDFFPRWYGIEKFQWVMLSGSSLTGQWDFDVTAPKSPVTGFKERTDGTQMANRVVALGEGSEVKMLTSTMDQSAGSSFLPLDAVVSYKSETDQARLDARARADLAARAKPTKQYSMDFFQNGDLPVWALRLGGTVRWKTQRDPWLPDGWRSSRLIEFSGDLSDKIHLELQTQGG